MAISLCFGGTPGSHLRNTEVPRNLCWKTLPKSFENIIFQPR